MNDTTIKDLASIVRGHMSNGQAGKDALAALLARVAELEAAAAGETGTPKAYGRYWCEFAPAPAGGGDMFTPRPTVVWWEHNGWWHSELFKCHDTVLRFYRLPSETYTPVEKPHDT